jgi:hypothetical protein
MKYPLVVVIIKKSFLRQNNSGGLQINFLKRTLRKSTYLVTLLGQVLMDKYDSVDF